MLSFFFSTSRKLRKWWTFRQWGADNIPPVQIMKAGSGILRSRLKSSSSNYVSGSEKTMLNLQTKSGSILANLMSRYWNSVKDLWLQPWSWLPVPTPWLGDWLWAATRTTCSTMHIAACISLKTTNWITTETIRIDFPNHNLTTQIISRGNPPEESGA